MRHVIALAGLCGLLAVVAGCGSNGPPMAEASGIVNYNNAPLEGATIVFQPDSGPLAVGSTDAEGRFTLMTGGKAQAMVGPGKISITAVEQLIFFENESEVSSQALANASRTLIPEKYGHVTTSGLTAEVPTKGTDELKFDLQGPPITRSTKEPRKIEKKPIEA